jgi:hypothetical protein
VLQERPAWPIIIEMAPVSDQSDPWATSIPTGVGSFFTHMRHRLVSLAEWNIGPQFAGSIRFDVGRSDYLAPLQLVFASVEQNK